MVDVSSFPERLDNADTIVGNAEIEPLGIIDFQGEMNWAGRLRPDGYVAVAYRNLWNVLAGSWATIARRSTAATK